MKVYIDLVNPDLQVLYIPICPPMTKGKASLHYILTALNGPPNTAFSNYAQHYALLSVCQHILARSLFMGIVPSVVVWNNRPGT